MAKPLLKSYLGYIFRRAFSFPMSKKIHFEVLPKPQRLLWDQIRIQAPLFRRSGFYLAGGTALALQIGHRQSVDFDFFSKQPTIDWHIQSWVESFPKSFVRERDQKTLHVEINGVKISFIGNYSFKLVQKASFVDGIQLASLVDIGLMKLLAVTHRATLRDYLDLAALFRDHVSLDELIDLSPKKYGKNFNPMLALRALITFQDIDLEIPRMLDKTLARSWKAIVLNSVKSHR
jgi:Nucleotidyl transferase AbiEii toxin, Type IV TA system